MLSQYTSLHFAKNVNNSFKSSTRPFYRAHIGVSLAS